MTSLESSRNGDGCMLRRVSLGVLGLVVTACSGGRRCLEVLEVVRAACSGGRRCLEVLEVMVERRPLHAVHGVASFVHAQRHHGRAAAEHADLIGLQDKTV